jgi:hypothetical protein
MREHPLARAIGRWRFELYSRHISRNTGYGVVVYAGSVILVRSRIRYVPEQIDLDLNEPDLGHPRGTEIIEKHYRQSERHRPEHNRGNPAFVCITHLGSTNPGLYIKKIRGLWWAVHYESGECPPIRLPAPMSEEHKRQREYWARAGEDAGWHVEVEKRLDTGTQPDALIYGPVATGVEVQLSSMTAAHAVGRTRKAQRAGVTDLWFTASDIATVGGKYRPLWAHRVPTVGAVRMPWDVLPPRRSATATGLRKIHPARCTVSEFGRCPYHRGRGPSHCGGWHPQPQPWPGLTVDDVAGQFPAGQIVALTFEGYQRHDDVFLIPGTEVAMYEELTGLRARLAYLDADTESGGVPGPVECRSPQPAALSRFGQSPAAWAAPPRPGVCVTPGCDRPARLYPGGWRCKQCLPLPFASEYLGKLP